MNRRLDCDQPRGHRSPKSCLHAVPCTSNRPSNGERNQGQGSNSTRRQGYEEGRPTPFLAPILHPLWLWSQSRQRPWGRSLSVHSPAQCKCHLGTASPRAKASRAQGFLYQDEVFKLFLPREVALHSHAPLPRSDHEFPIRIPSQIPPSRAITAPPLARWRRAHFRCVFLRVRPGGRCRCRPTSSSLFATQTITVMACGQFGWSRAALLHLLLGLNLMVMPPTQARSLRFVTLVTT